MAGQLTRQRLLHLVAAQSQMAGYEAAVVDVAQDYLLHRLKTVGLLDLLVFKGGTALRKLHAGSAGRFSLDLDFSVANIGDAPASVLNLLREEVHGLTIGPFEYAISDRRGKLQIEYSSVEFQIDSPLMSKLDVTSPPWLPSQSKPWVKMAIHEYYGFALPELSACSMEENLAEKIVRLNRLTPARDMYDLMWVGRNQLTNRLDVALIRRLVVLKNWVDAYGVTAGDGTAWGQSHSTRPFEPDRWLLLRDPEVFDAEDIGLLAIPAPSFAELSTEVSQRYAFLKLMDADEARVSKNDPSDRATVLRMLADLPGGRLAECGLY